MTPRFNAIGLAVADMGTAVAFYRHLGLEFASDTEDHEECLLTEGVRLMLDTVSSVQSFTSDWTEPSGSSRVGLAFQFETPAAVDAMYEKLIKAGYQGSHEPWDAFWGQRYASITDPDGNGVDLYATLPTTP